MIGGKVTDDNDNTFRRRGFNMLKYNLNIIIVWNIRVIKRGYIIKNNSYLKQEFHPLGVNWKITWNDRGDGGGSWTMS